LTKRIRRVSEDKFAESRQSANARPVPGRAVGEFACQHLAGVSIFIACLGLVGLSSFSADQRAKRTVRVDSGTIVAFKAIRKTDDRGTCHIARITVIGQAIQAAGANPVKSLRSE
jgi:hypothetical protein